MITLIFMDFDAISPLKIALSLTGSGNHVTVLFIFGISLNITEIIKYCSNVSM